MWINEMDDNNVTKDWKEELGILCYKVSALHILFILVTFESGLRLVKICVV